MHPIDDAVNKNVKQHILHYTGKQCCKSDSTFHVTALNHVVRRPNPEPCFICIPLGYILVFLSACQPRPRVCVINGRWDLWKQAVQMFSAFFGGPLPTPTKRENNGLDDGWPESETCDCPALWKRYIEREKERMDVKEWQCGCAGAIQMCRCMEVER